MNITRIFTSTAFFSLLAIALNANSAVLKINKSQSSFSKNVWYCNQDCNTEEQYQISGIFEVTFDMFGEATEVIQFNPMVVKTTAPGNEIFKFPDYRVAFEENAFSGSGDPCALWSGPGTCYSMGNFGWLSGEFDGTNLVMRGGAGIDKFYSYHYTILAAVVPKPTAVPLPRALSALLIVSVLLLVLSQDRKIFRTT